MSSLFTVFLAQGNPFILGIIEFLLLPVVLIPSALNTFGRGKTMTAEKELFHFNTEVSWISSNVNRLDEYGFIITHRKITF